MIKNKYDYHILFIYHILSYYQNSPVGKIKKDTNFQFKHQHQKRIKFVLQTIHRSASNLILIIHK